MADDKKNDKSEGKGEGEEPKARKKTPLIAGGVVGVLALGYMAALMAVPKTDGVHRLKGPFVDPLFPEPISVNLIDSSRRRFLKLQLNIVYSAYDETYFVTRSSDPLFAPLMRDAVLRVASAKMVDEVFDDEVAGSVFMEEMREAMEPILFPILIGSGTKPSEYDEESGIRIDIFSDPATFRGLFFDHALKIDAGQKTLQFDEGPEVSFEGGETSIEITTPEGTRLFVDVSELDEEFVGEVNVGVHGTIRQILWEDRIVQ